MKNVLIITNPDDLHAILVGEVLRRKGANVTLWQTSEFPNGATETVSFEESLSGLEIDGVGDLGELQKIDTVWNRRPQLLWGTTPVIEEDREFTELQCEIFREGLFHCLAPGAFWVNPPGTAKQVRSKLRQHREATLVGLRLPKTVYTNNPTVIRQFIRDHGDVVYKPLFPMSWGELGEGWGIYTTRITEEGLVTDQLLQAVPGIYQEVVPKAHELRVTIMGRHVFVGKILSQETDAGRLDWRLAGPDLKIERAELTPDVAERCFSLMKRLGIVYGALDFIVTPAGDYVFLEVNQMGQFAFIEEFGGIPLIDAMSEFLIQGRVDFQWREDQVRTRMKDIENLVEDQQREIAKNHLKRPTGVLYPHQAHLL